MNEITSPETQYLVSFYVVINLILFGMGIIRIIQSIRKKDSSIFWDSPVSKILALEIVLFGFIVMVIKVKTLLFGDPL